MNNNEIIKHAKAIQKHYEGRSCGDCIFFNDNCKIGHAIPSCWSIPKQQILDKKEKEYLSNVIRPFRENVKYIKKEGFRREYIAIGIKNEPAIAFPYLTNKKMYQGMEINREYTLEELGL